jgi:hypothetical protein
VRFGTRQYGTFFIGAALTVWAVGFAAAAPRAPEPDGETSAAPSAPAQPAASVSFRRDVAPVLVKNCLACHGPAKSESGFRVDTFEHLARPGDGGSSPFVAGKPEESEIVRLVTSTEKEERMPKEGDPLPAGQIDALRRWIAAGAAFDGPSRTAPLASYLPREPHPAPPDAYPAPVPITALAFHPSGSELFVGGYHEVTVWDAAAGKLLRRLRNCAQRTHAIVPLGDGAALAVASGTPGRVGEARIISASDGAELRFLGGFPDEALDAALSPDGQRLAVAAADRSIRVYGLGSGTEERLIENHADWVTAVTFSADGGRLASASRDKTAKVFETATGQLVATYSGHAEAVYGVAFKPDGNQVFSSGRDGKIHAWNVSDGNRAGDIGGFGGEVYKLLLSGESLLCASADKTVRQFRAGDRGHVRTFAGHADWVFAVAVHGPTRRLASGGFDGQVRIWSLDDGKLLAQFTAAPGLAAGAGTAPR